MPAPKGNQFWRLVDPKNRSRKFMTPRKLWNACVKYFEWVENNPLIEEKVFQYQGDIVRTTVEKMRPMTKEGLYAFLGINRQTWTNYRNREDFTDMVLLVESIIFEQKFSGAAADLMNPAIIARELGLAESHKHSSPDGSMSVPSVINVKSASDSSNDRGDK